MYKLALFFAVLFFVACGPSEKSAAPAPEVSRLDSLIERMTGSFSSALQAENDSDFYAIRLEMHPVWSDTDAVHWLYVEQALESTLEQPYRQRIYRVFEEDSVFISEIYLTPNPKVLIGQWENDSIWSSLHPDSLTLKDGCAVKLRYNGTEFVGATDSAACPSDMRGASFAMSEVIIDDDGLTSWDRGFDSTGVQVWGAEKGGYRFDRIEVAE